MNWIDFISQLSLADKNSYFKCNRPANMEMIDNLKTQLNLSELPQELEALYKQTNGVNEQIRFNENTDEIDIGELIWSIKRVIESNLEYRNYPDFKNIYMSFEQLFFISDAGNGDLFAYVTLNGQFERDDIFVWNHENDSRTWVAPNLYTFLKWWRDGTIKI